MRAYLERGMPQSVRSCAARTEVITVDEGRQ